MAQPHQQAAAAAAAPPNTGMQLPDGGGGHHVRPPSSRPSSRERQQRPPSREPRPVSREVCRGGGEGEQPLSLVSVVPVMPGRLTTAYDVQKPVGKGGYAIVYKGIRAEDGRVVAVKKVEIFEMSQKKRERCLQEVTLLSQLSHPNIIQMLDAFIDENMLIIIFEWAPAGDLKRLIKKTAEQGKALDEPSIWNFFYQVTDGLRYMHQHRIMHRDIKPANVLVGANGALKLGDLGLGRQLSEQTMEAFSKVGTPYYVSPEVVRGAGYDWKSDVWSMGCLLYELALLRSPFEMEGANLYDVFQRISKGDFTPLPAGQFSGPLRSLVGRMLQIDPALRPELEEVWLITSGAVQSQARTRSDVHGAATEVYEQLVLLGGEVAARLAGPSPSSSTPPSSRPSSRQRSAGRRQQAPPQQPQGPPLALVPPPAETMRALHPLYFSEPLVSALRPDAEAFQKQQLGCFLHVFGWLLRLHGKAEAASAVEAHLEFVPSKRTATSRLAAARAGSVKAGGRAGGAPLPPPPQQQQQATVPVCTNLLKGAEAAKKGALALGLSIEFAPVNAIALGHGRAVCCILQDTLGATLQRLPLTCRPIVRQAEGDAEEVEELDDAAMEGKQEVVMERGRHGGGGEDDGEEDEYYCAGGRGSTGRTAASSSSPPPPAKAAATAAAAAAVAAGAGAAAGGIAPVLHSQADPSAWRQEAERVAPQLGQIRLAADAAGGDWMQRWAKVKGALGSLAADTPGAGAALGRLRGAVGSDLERIDTSEARLNGCSGALLRRYEDARRRLEAVQAERDGLEARVARGHGVLGELTERLAEAQQAIQDRAEGLDGSRAIKQMHDAMRAMRKELRGMDVRCGVVQQLLLDKQRLRLRRGHAAAAAEGGSGSDDDGGAM